LIVKVGTFIRALSGKGSNVVFEDTEFGTVGREYVIPTVRAYFSSATQAFAQLPKAKVDAWNAYARQFKTRNKAGKMRAKRGLNVYAALYTKWKFVNPTGTFPQDPPTTPFSDDLPVISVTAGTGKLTFTASVPNTTGVTTELLFQKLVNGNRKPQKNAYKTGAYFTFAIGALTKDVTVPPGYFAAGYRFVKVATGQQSEFRPLPVSQVTFAVAKKAA
jgi:hypothetical protein